LSPNGERPPHRRRAPLRLTRLAAVAVAGMVLTKSAVAGPGPAAESATCPATKIVPVEELLHGTAVVDPYRWLENAGDPEVQKWTEAQNAWTRGRLDSFPGREKLRARIEKLLEIGVVGTPRVAGDNYFYTRRETQNQPILYVRRGVNGEDRPLVDVNPLSKDGTTSLDWWFPSRDGSLLAYGTSEKGDEESVLRIRDVATGQDRPDVIDRTRHASLAWLPDNSGFYYSRYPAKESVPEGETQFHRKVFFHLLGSDPSADPEIFGSERPMEDWPNVDISPDGRWLVVSVERGWSRTDLYLKDRSNDSPFVTMVEGRESVSTADAQNDRIFVRTNDGAPNYRVYSVDPFHPARDDWREIIPESKSFVLDWAGVIAKRLVVSGLEKATGHLRIHTLEGKRVAELKLPTLGSLIGLGGREDGQELFFGFTSFTVPPTIYRHDFKTKKREVWKKVEAGFDVSSFVTKQIEYKSKDGTAVTMFLVHKKGIRPGGGNPALLTGYGGFNVSETPSFSRSIYFWIEQGGVYALPNLRGGGEYGESWHKAGMLGNKQNVFDDFFGASKWLIDNKWAVPDRLVIQGGSNGGLLIGAAVTQHPEMFRAAICAVPLLDMLRYHQFRLGKLWIPEYGSADDPEQFRWLEAYSPYQHTRKGVRYPAVLFTAAESDSRVDPMHARKMAARLQAATSASPSDRPILLRLETKAGHGAGKPLGKVVDEVTDNWSFLFGQLGMKISTE